MLKCCYGGPTVRRFAYSDNQPCGQWIATVKAIAIGGEIVFRACAGCCTIRHMAQVALPAAKEALYNRDTRRISSRDT
jgi:hypothetical protein